MSIDLSSEWFGDGWRSGSFQIVQLQTNLGGDKGLKSLMRLVLRLP
jgi:hypothetical protein